MRVQICSVLGTSRSDLDRGRFPNFACQSGLNIGLGSSNVKRVWEGFGVSRVAPRISIYITENNIEYLHRRNFS